MLIKTELSAMELNASAERIKSLRRGATEHAVEIGRELLRVKERLPHGAFVKWVEKACEFKIRTAQDLMKLARETDSDAKLVALMVPSTLRVYLSKTTPPKVRTGVLKRLKRGDHVSRNELQSEIMNAKPTASAKAGNRPAEAWDARPDRRQAERCPADYDADRARWLAELFTRRLSRSEYELVMKDMNWEVWNRILVWMRALRDEPSAAPELAQPGDPAIACQLSAGSKLQ